VSSTTAMLYFPHMAKDWTHLFEKYRGKWVALAEDEITVQTTVSGPVPSRRYAPAAASSAYLTVSEIFPLEARALAIAIFYALGTAIPRHCDDSTARWRAAVSRSCSHAPSGLGWMHKINSYAWTDAIGALQFETCTRRGASERCKSVAAR
jgi:hypothetical protein